MEVIMNDINIKQEIMDLCDISIEFWKRFKEEINSIPENDKVELVLKWKNFFVENNAMPLKLTETKLCAEEITKELIMQGKLFIEE